MKNIIFILTIVLALFVAGCATQIVTKYQCQNGQVVDSLELCSSQKCLDIDNSKCPKQTETKTITKYVCSNGLVMDAENDCKSNDEIETEGDINPKTIESCIKDNHNSDTIMTKFNFDANTLDIQFRSPYSGETNIIPDMFDVTVCVVKYIDSLNIEPNIKIKGTNKDASWGGTTTLSWSSAKKLISYQMTYEEWLKTLN